MVLALADGLIERGEDRYYIAGLQARAGSSSLTWRPRSLIWPSSRTRCAPRRLRRPGQLRCGTGLPAAFHRLRVTPRVPSCQGAARDGGPGHVRIAVLADVRFQAGCGGTRPREGLFSYVPDRISKDREVAASCHGDSPAKAGTGR